MPPEYTKALELLALTSLATTDQVAEILFHELNEENVWDAIDYIIYRDFVAEVREYPFSNPLAKPVLYLTQKGKQELRQKSPLAANYAVAGKPDRRKPLNGKLALLVAESIIEWRKQFKEIRFFNRRQLSNPLILDQIKSLGFAVPENGKFECEYGVIFRSRPENPERFLLCRIAVKQTIENIKNYPKGIMWFPASIAQEKVIAEAISFKAPVLNPLGIERWEELNAEAAVRLRERRNPPVSTELDNFDTRILNFLDEFNLVLSVNELVGIFRKRDEPEEIVRAKISYCRKKLDANGYVRLKRGKVRPAFNFGRPAQYLYLPRNEKFFERKCFQRNIILGHLCSLKLQEGWKIVKFDPAVPALTMSKEGRIEIFVSDYADGEQNEVVDKTLDNFRNFAESQKIPDISNSC